MTVLALATYFSGGDTAGPAMSAVDPRAEERALVALAQAGDLPAFEALYRRNVQRVCALCFRLADDAAAAEELVQEVFARAWMSLNSFRGDSAFASWLHPMAVRLALDDRRARRHAPGCSNWLLR